MSNSLVSYDEVIEDSTIFTGLKPTDVYVDLTRLESTLFEESRMNMLFS